jgi:hypothetical protein
MATQLTSKPYSFIGGSAGYWNKEQAENVIAGYLAHIPDNNALIAPIYSFVSESEYPCDLLKAPLERLKTAADVTELIEAMHKITAKNAKADELRLYHYDIAAGKVMVTKDKDIKAEWEKQCEGLYFGKIDTLPGYAYLIGLYGGELPLLKKFMDEQISSRAALKAVDNLSVAGGLHHHMSGVSCLVSKAVRGALPFFITDGAARGELDGVIPMNKKERKYFEAIRTMDAQGSRDAYTTMKAGKYYKGRPWEKLKPLHEQAIENKSFFSFGRG